LHPVDFDLARRSERDIGDPAHGCKPPKNKILWFIVSRLRFLRKDFRVFSRPCAPAVRSGISPHFPIEKNQIIQRRPTHFFRFHNYNDPYLM
ncbi:MAG: hypothetical protein IKD61_01360, partial [Oscillospiraceae bacterium]|nr:hypothetical protein [Oscillospiraceae bacterium]